MSDFPTLQGESTTGKCKIWTIRVFERVGHGIIETSHGYADGKIQTNEKIITAGKNIGKKNETTPLQQAISEAHSAWIKKKESGYTEINPSNKKRPLDTTHISSGPRSKGIVEEVPSPMLAHEYQKRGKSFRFPCYTQPKLDGTRCIAIQRKGLFSRLKKSFPHMEHIMEEINRIPSLEPYILDGELYSDQLTFQEIVGIVKRETLKPGDIEKQQQIKFYVYDIITSMDYENRLTQLYELFDTHHHLLKYIVFVPTHKCISFDEMKKQHDIHVSNGYEGIMLRNPKGVYKHSRSVDLLKYKEFFDGDYKVIGFKEGDGLESGCVIWNCQTIEGKEFYCRPKGTREDRIQLFQEGSSYIGKMLTVKYQELTDDGLPRFPVGITFRDYE